LEEKEKNKTQRAIEIFKAKLPDAKGNFKAYASESNQNEVDIFSDDGLYCTVNVKTEKIKNI